MSLYNYRTHKRNEGGQAAGAAPLPAPCKQVTYGRPTRFSDHLLTGLLYLVVIAALIVGVSVIAILGIRTLGNDRRQPANMALDKTPTAFADP